MFEYFNSDKGDFCYNQYAQPSKQKKDKIIGHGYAKIYENFFNKLRESKLNILEIGSFYGNASAALNFYFKNANIFSADINPDMYSYKGVRLKNFYVDSSSRESIQKNIIDKIPMNRIGHPEEISDGIAFLASASASDINGINLVVDGGRMSSF